MIDDAILAKKCTCLIINDAGRKSLKMTHDYYYQIQIAMLCTNTQWCDFFLRTTIDVHCERIALDLRMCCSILPSLENSISVLFYPNLLFHVTQRFVNLRSGYKTKKRGYIEYACLRTQLYNHHINFFTYSYVLICLITP